MNGKRNEYKGYEIEYQYTVRGEFMQATIYENNRAVNGAVANTEAEALKQAKAMIDEWEGIEDDDYGLTNEQDFGASAEAKAAAKQRETTATRYVVDEHHGEITVETEIKSEPQPETTRYLKYYDTGVWIRADVANGICTMSGFLAPRAELVNWPAEPDYSGQTVNQLIATGFKPMADCVGFLQFINVI